MFINLALKFIVMKIMKIIVIITFQYFAIAPQTGKIRFVTFIPKVGNKLKNVIIRM